MSIQKKLRSLLLEELPLEMRVEIDLLSRRRDISNKEKQAEIFSILRKYGIENVTPLGPGTNRYAFKLKGYVIKVATDNDGKIDNFKEFKMAKRLFPHVIKVYEVSNNGTLLVTEYIQPFQSFSEMMKYSDQIRDILKKLSSVYLIGDVGITAKNYANWGLRIGSEEPVCLDFAYVYEVSSELFLCTNCKTGMLSPNKDFTELFCTNSACGKKYLFEDIRRKLGNDVHKQEIGDLTLEGYELTESKVIHELDPSRSNYLEGKKKKTEINEVKEEIPEDTDFVYDTNKEETDMKNSILAAIVAAEEFKVNGTVVEATVVSPDENLDVVEDEEDIIDNTDDESYGYNYPSDAWEDVNDNVVDVAETKQPASSLAFSANIATDEIQTAVATNIDEDIVRVEESVKSVKEEPVMAEEPVSDIPESNVIDNDDFVMSADEPEEPEPDVIEPVVEETITEVAEDEAALPAIFYDQLQKAISKFANLVAEFAYTDQLFDDIINQVTQKKFFAGDFKQLLSPVVFRSLVNFFKMKELQVPNAKGNGTHKEWEISTDGIENKHFFPTLKFIHKFWITRSLNSSASKEEFMTEYMSKYKVPQDGILQWDWIDGALKERIKLKMPLTDGGIETVLNWFRWFPAEEKPVSDPVPPDEAAEEVNAVEEVKVEKEPVSVDDMIDAAVDAVSESAPEAAEETVYDSDDEDEEDSGPITVTLHHDADTGFDVIKLQYEDIFGENTIPLYIKDLESVKPATKDNMWNFLRKVQPYMVFTTKRPRPYIYFGSETSVSETVVKFLRIGTMGYDAVIGAFDFGGFYVENDEGELIPADDALILKVCSVLNKNIGAFDMDFTTMAMAMKDDWAKEEEIIKYLKAELGDIDDIDFDDEEEQEVEPIQKPVKAAQPQKKVEEEPQQVFQPVHRGSIG